MSGDVQVRFCERRGARFPPATLRKVYVASERAGQRVMESITQYIEEKLKLRVSRGKSAVDRATKRPLLGFRFLYRKGDVVVAVDWKARVRAKDRLRQLTSRRWSVSMERRITEINRFTVGWTAYFALADTPWPFEELDKWLRRRLRQVRWKQWKLVRTRLHKLRAAGIPEADARRWANSRKGYWRVSNSNVLHLALPKRLLGRLGPEGIHRPLPPFPVMLSEPPDADPHVRWCGRGRGEPGPYPI